MMNHHDFICRRMEVEFNAGSAIYYTAAARQARIGAGIQRISGEELMRNSHLRTLVLGVALAACGDDKKSNSGTGPDQQCARGMLALGTARTGSAAEGDCVLDLSSTLKGFYDSYTVVLTQGRVYQVQVDATVAFTFDSFVEVVDPGGALVAKSDNDFWSLDSELFLLASQTGTFTIRAGGYPRATSDYRVTVRECGTTTISSSATISGTLSTSDCRSTYAFQTDSTIVDLYVLPITGSSRTITVTSSSFEPYIIGFGPGFASSESSFLRFVARSPAIFTFPAGLAPGSYIVLVGSATRFGATGSYTIQTSGSLTGYATTTAARTADVQWTTSRGPTPGR